MRPVNLIPPEQRRGEHAQLRTGPLVYIVVGALALVLAGVTALVLTENQIAESKAEVTTLKREDAAAQAQAKRLAAYSQFRTLAEQRVATVRSLADSRFNWERVMRELSLVLPSDVWLTNLNATATASTSVGGGESGGGSSSASSLRGAIAGPALELSGCAAGQEAVAEFVTALKDIDGVTRVGVESSELGSKGNEAGSGGGGSGDCRTRQFIARFSLVIAFDAAPVPPEEGEEVAGATAAATETAPTASTETAPTASTETSGSSESSGEGSGG
jgi:Tfp pilus assembly protein PilN